jgi:hypothetical protein
MKVTENGGAFYTYFGKEKLEKIKYKLLKQGMCSDTQA